MADVAAEHIQFRLRVDGRIWKMPDLIETSRIKTSPLLYREDGKAVKRSLSEPFCRDDLDGYERQIEACDVIRRPLFLLHFLVGDTEFEPATSCL